MNIGDIFFFITLFVIYLANFLRIGYLIDRDIETTFLTIIFFVLEIFGTIITYFLINSYFYKMNFANSAMSSSVLLILILLAALSEYYDIRKERKSYQKIEREKW